MTLRLHLRTATRRVVVFSAIGLAVVVAAPGSTGLSAAAPAVGVVEGFYPIPAPELTTDKSVYSPKGRGIVRLDGFNGCPSVTIVIEGVPGSLTAVPDENGTVTIEVTMPGEPGEYTITATCTVGDQSATGTIEVSDTGTITVPTDPPDTDPADTDPSAPTTAGGGRLPTTGSEAGQPVLVGLVLLVSGVAFLFVTRMRRRRTLP